MAEKHYTTLKKGLNFIEYLVASNSIDLNHFLHEMAEFLSKSAHSTSCLIYVYNKNQKSMTLIGTVKGRKKFIEHLILKKGEGITGWVAQHTQNVFIKKEAYKDTRFKFIEGLPEDKYEGFLSLPIMLKAQLLGVVNLQYKNPVNLSHSEIDMLQSLVNILAYSFSIYLLQHKVVHLNNKLASRKIVEEAKGVLMEKFALTESQAYKRLRDEAMRQRKGIEELSASIILVKKVI